MENSAARGPFLGILVFTDLTEKVFLVCVQKSLLLSEVPEFKADKRMDETPSKT